VIRRLRTLLGRTRTAPARIERIDHLLSASVPQHLDALAEHVTRRVRDQGDVHRGETALAFQQLTLAVQDLADRVSIQRAELDGRLTQLAEELAQRVASADERQRRDTAWLRQAIADLGALADRNAEAISAAHTDLADRSGRIAHIGLTGFEAALIAQRDSSAAMLIDAHSHTGPRVDGLTVIMTTWNHAAWLPEAVASALATREALADDHFAEILILNDASTDETESVLTGYLDDPTVRVINSPVNIALGRARNVLLAACRTRHAVILDADNWLLPHGVSDIYSVAREHGSAITYGHVIAATDADTDWTTFSCPPSALTLRTGEAFDSMCIIDVEQVLHLGGYTCDPALAGIADDFELFNRTLRRRHLVAFVPTVIGRYRISPNRHSTGIAHEASIHRRIARSYHYDNPDFDRMNVIVAHPRSGVLWTTSAAATYAPAEERTSISRHGCRPAQRVLMITSGGVDNLGDDAIGERVLQRIRSLTPEAYVDVATDGGPLSMTGRPARWIGTVQQVWQSLTDKQISSLLVAGESAAWLTPIERVSPVTDLARYDSIIIAGGGNLNDEFADGQARPRLAIALAASQLGVSVTWSGQGIGPCDDRLLRRGLRLSRSAQRRTAR
jgi:glycosyltransferase involved in cell wall biosynthesis